MGTSVFVFNDLTPPMLGLVHWKSPVEKNKKFWLQTKSPQNWTNISMSQDNQINTKTCAEIKKNDNTFSTVTVSYSWIFIILIINIFDFPISFLINIKHAIEQISKKFCDNTIIIKQQSVKCKSKYAGFRSISQILTREMNTLTAYTCIILIGIKNVEANFSSTQFTFLFLIESRMQHLLEFKIWFKIKWTI